MEAKEVIVAQAVANAELMVERDNLRNEVIKLRKEIEEIVGAQEKEDGGEAVPPYSGSGS